MQVFAALSGGAILFFAIVIAITLGYRAIYSGRIFPGVAVAGVDVGGMRPIDAAAKLGTTLSYPYSGRIVFKDGDRVWVTTPAQLGMVFDPSASANIAFDLGRESGLFGNLNDMLNSAQVGVDVSPITILDQRVAYAYLQGLGSQINRPVVEADLKINGTDVIAYPGQIGRSLNVDATLVYLNAQLQSFRDGEVPLVIQEQDPEVEDVSAQADLARRILSQPLTLIIPDMKEGDPGPWSVDPTTLAAMMRVNRVRTDQGVEYLLQIDPGMITPQLQSISQQVDRGKADARFHFNDDTRQLDLIRSATIGRAIKIDGTIEAIDTAFQQGQSTVSLALDLDEPDIKDDATAQKLGLTQNISTYTSYFRGSTTARLQNIQTAAAQFDGLLVPPGAVFSMGSALGDVSLDSGYAEAMIIYGGRTIKGVGGGVCQVSTTLFRTAFFAGFPILERYAHAYRVSYYEQKASGIDVNMSGLDATVYFPVVDFKFKNDSPHWLLMETYFDAKNYSLTWKFYSTSDGRTVSWNTTGPTNVTEPPKPLLQLNPALGEFDLKQVDYAALGADVTVTRTVYLNNAVLFEDQFVTHYQAWQAICEYGKSVDDPEKTAKKKGLCQS
jgi:vancomycin resistance protein YoaR